MKKLQVNVDQIPDEGLALRVKELAERFPGLKAIGSEESVRFNSPIDIEMQVRRISRFVEAGGSLRTSVRLFCSRCLGEFSQSLSIPFEATYSEEVPALDVPREDTEIELTAEAIDLLPFHGRQIDLVEAIQEHLLLALPVRPLCREDCKGLCPKCGADLNQGPCECTEKPIDPRFSILKNLKIE